MEQCVYIYICFPPEILLSMMSILQKHASIPFSAFLYVTGVSLCYSTYPGCFASDILLECCWSSASPPWSVRSHTSSTVASNIVSRSAANNAGNKSREFSWLSLSIVHMTWSVCITHKIDIHQILSPVLVLKAGGELLFFPTPQKGHIFVGCFL